MRSIALKKLFMATATCLLGMSTAVSASTSFPDRQISFVVPYPAGGAGDSVARIIANQLEPIFGVSIVVENRPGGGAVIGTDAVLRAKPDGHTWLLGSTSNISNMAFVPNNKQDMDRDLAPVAMLGSSVNAFVVPASSPFKSVAEYVEYAKENPDKLMYGTGGVGSSQFLGFETLKQETGIKVDPVHYKGAPPMITELASGQLSAAFLPVVIAQGMEQNNKLKILAVANSERLTNLPEVPTMAEAGFPKASVSPWFSIHVPVGTPAPAIAKIETSVQKVMEMDEVKEGFSRIGTVPNFLGTKELDAFVKSEIAKWKQLAETIEEQH